MEAWILHIRTEWYDSPTHLHHFDEYTAWMTEKQANKAASKYLKERAESFGSGLFHEHYPLREAIKALLEVDCIEQAISLINEYSIASPYKSSSSQSSKVYITITKSTFLGSPFE